MGEAPSDAYLEIGRTVEIDGHEIEILRTLADCIGTKLVFRSDAPFDSRLTPHPVWPPEITSNWSCHGGDVMEAEFDPVLPERAEIQVVFARSFGDRDNGTPVTIPVDRRRTARFERMLGDPAPMPTEADGAEIAVTDALVGALSGSIDLAITCRDESILACEIGWPHHIHGPRGPGPDALWNDWRPDSARVERTTSRTGEMKVELASSASVTVIGRVRPKGSHPPVPEKPRPPDPPSPVAVNATPKGHPLQRVAAHKRRENPGPPIESWMRATHAPPPPDADGVELALSGLYLFRFAGGRITTVPFPSSDSDLDLTGIAFDTDHGPVELLRWEQGLNSIPSLVVRTPSPWWWPDIRVLHDDQSVSFWMHPGHDGTLNGILPRMYEAAFQDPAGVRLALRLLGRPAAEVSIPIRLTPPGA